MKYVCKEVKNLHIQEVENEDAKTNFEKLSIKIFSGGRKQLKIHILLLNDTDKLMINQCIAIHAL